jgi:hypothetical protein
VPGVGEAYYTKNPGVYGERDDISEEEITTRTSPGTIGMPVPINELVAERIEKLATRRVNRMTWVLAKLITEGSYIVPGVTGAIVDRDAFTPLTYTATVPWATVATAKPIYDFRANLTKGRGQSVSFGAGATAIMNQATFNDLMSNTNAADLGGIKSQYGATVQGLDAVNMVQMNNGLPKIVIDDTGYIDEAGAFQLWIPNNKVVLVGVRSNGASVGEFLLTRNVSNPNNSAQPLVRVVDHGLTENSRPPRRIEVFSGLNGGPAIYYNGSVVIMTV